MALIDEVHGSTEFEIHLNTEDFRSRLDRINQAEAILIFGFEIQQNETWPYRIAKHLELVEPPVIPFTSKYSFFPPDESELTRQKLGPETTSFIDKLVPNCPGGKLPVRTEWVGRVLNQNGYQTTLTGDPAWYAPEMIGETFHKPQGIDQLVLTTPHSPLFRDQATRLIRRLAAEFPDARRIVSYHSGPSELDDILATVAQDAGWEIRYTSHEAEKIEFYRQSDLHIGYRFHGHLAHLRWRRPSILLAEDSRAAGLNETLGTAGVSAVTSRPTSGLQGFPRRFADSTPVVGLHLILKKFGYTDVLPRNSPLKATVNDEAIEQVFSFIDMQQTSDWNAYSQIREIIDETYQKKMKPFIQNLLVQE